MKGIVILLGIIIVAGALYLFYTERATAPASALDYIPANGPLEDTNAIHSGGEGENELAGPVGDEPFAALVTYTDNGFEPKTVAINAGETVRFVNQAETGMWVASNDHPTHTKYDGSVASQHCIGSDPLAGAFDTCRVLSAGEFWEFTFDKTGSWGYHNHRRSSDTGTIAVE